MSLTKKQLKLAAEILAMSQMCNSDSSGADSKQEIDLINFTIKHNKEKFSKKYPNENQVPLTLMECIELAKKTV